MGKQQEDILGSEEKYTRVWHPFGSKVKKEEIEVEDIVTVERYNQWRCGSVTEHKLFNTQTGQHTDGSEPLTL